MPHILVGAYSNDADEWEIQMRIHLRGRISYATFVAIQVCRSAIDSIKSRNKHDASLEKSTKTSLLKSMLQEPFALGSELPSITQIRSMDKTKAFESLLQSLELDFDCDVIRASVVVNKHNQLPFLASTEGVVLIPRRGLAQLQKTKKQRQEDENALFEAALDQSLSRSLCSGTPTATTTSPSRSVPVVLVPVFEAKGPGSSLPSNLPKANVYSESMMDVLVEYYEIRVQFALLASGCSNALLVAFGPAACTGGQQEMNARLLQKKNGVADFIYSSCISWARHFLAWAWTNTDLGLGNRQVTATHVVCARTLSALMLDSDTIRTATQPLKNSHRIVENLTAFTFEN